MTLTVIASTIRVIAIGLRVAIPDTAVQVAAGQLLMLADSLERIDKGEEPKPLEDYEASLAKYLKERGED